MVPTRHIPGLLHAPGRVSVPTYVPALALGVALLTAFLAAGAPDPGSSDFPAFGAIIGATLATGLARMRRLPREEIEWRGFTGAFFGAVVGLLVYAVGLSTGLY